MSEISSHQTPAFTPLLKAGFWLLAPWLIKPTNHFGYPMMAMVMQKWIIYLRSCPRV